MWSYAHLNALADRLARHLRALGVGPEIPVAMAAERVPEVVVGLLAILKAGGVCLPLDPSHPRERLAFLLRDAGARVLLARRAIADHLPSPEVHGARVVGLDDPWPDSGAGEGGGVPSPGWGEGPDNLAYLIYTSGTTGVPKAVAVSHRQVMPILAWSLRFFPLDERIRVLQTLSPCFDFGVFELLTTLLAGGTLCFLPVAEQADLTCAVEAIERHRVSCIHATPSFFRELVALGRRLPGLEIVHLGGEALSRALVRQIAAAVGPRCRLYNGYGPTETSINSAMYPLRGRPLERGLPGPVVPIGRITAGSTGYVLDRRGRSVAVGVPGELSIGGAGLARGYLNRPAATAERFVPDPRGDAGQRLYRSGDLVRRLADGNLEYLGRIDHQVKIRGFRIEPGEIEAVLSSHPAIAQAVVTARESAAGDRRLAAYLVARAPGERLEEPLRDWIRERLPDHMVPASFVFLDELPRTPGGKLDHRALPEPGPPAEGNAAPSNPTERILAEVWARVLGLDPPISVDANFFELGGHSLLATRVALAAEQALGVELPVSALFAGPTVRRLAAILHRQRTAGSPLVTIRAEGRRPPLFCVHPSGGNVLCFAPLAQALGEDQPLYGLEARGLRAGEKPRRRIGEMATAYLEAIRSFRSRGPYLLLGYSLGGLVAYEMAQQLLADAQEVPLVAIVDVPARRLADSGAFRISTAQILLELLDHELALSRRELESLDPEQQLTAVLEAARAAGALSPELGRRHAQRYLDLLDAGSAAVRRYSPQPYPGRVVLFTAAGEARRSADETLGWGELVPALKLCRTPGRHLTMLRSPHVELLAARLRDLLDTSRPV